MNKEIKNNPQATKSIANKILDLCNVVITKTQSTDGENIGGRTAEINDKILKELDFDVDNGFKKVFLNSSLKFNKIADDFTESDINASV